MADDAITVTTRLEAEPGREALLEERLLALATAVRREEPGCQAYEVLCSEHRSTLFLLLERYRDDAALSAHANSSHLRDAFDGLMECLVSPPSVELFRERGGRG